MTILNGISLIPCCFGNNCKKTNCKFSHPEKIFRETKYEEWLEYIEKCENVNFAVLCNCPSHMVAFCKCEQIVPAFKKQRSN